MGLFDMFSGGSKPSADRKTTAALREALLAVNRDTAPFLIRDGAPEKCDLVAEWKIGNHIKPNGVAYDTANKRLFVSTRGDNPALLVYDPSGKIVAEQTIGLNNDSIVFDQSAKKIYTANGWDGTLVILDQVDANTYKLAEAATTRPWARTMALDPKTKTVYLVTAEGTVDPAKPWKTSVSAFYPNKYFKDTFTLLTYTRK